MQLAEPLVAGWRAELELGFESRVIGGTNRTVLATRRHDGPLVVQKPLYPEGDAVCHAIVIHPPAGIAGGDDLSLTMRAATGAHALLTTPGAGKWYRSAGAWASQRIRCEASDGAHLEWLPQETIVYDGALAQLQTDVDLQGDAGFIGWDILCLGRTGSGERLTRGQCRFATRVTRDGKLIWNERAAIAGGSAVLQSPAGLGGHTVSATLLAASPLAGGIDMAALRELNPAQGLSAVTRLPGLIVARYLGDASEAARDYFTRLWMLLRPALLQRDAQPPRIWRT